PIPQITDAAQGARAVQTDSPRSRREMSPPPPRPDAQTGRGQELENRRSDADEVIAVTKHVGPAVPTHAPSETAPLCEQRLAGFREVKELIPDSFFDTESKSANRLRGTIFTKLSGLLDLLASLERAALSEFQGGELDEIVASCAGRFREAMDAALPPQTRNA